ncbi:transcription factor bHLH62-like [Hibiscus syriacus]|uniref:transcription factor bHLH62-like n=1 Tax=Hibiscus syriacus TaxID=106335 RepID=UPI001922E396|nr:transcription factor bHLH62-like [Hibiscus syriacus]
MKLSNTCSRCSVELQFLSMKLATVNPRMNVNIEALLSKDIFQSRGSLPHAVYSVDSSAPAFGFIYQPKQALPMNNGISNNAEIQFSMNPLNAALHKTQGLQLPPVASFTYANAQIGSFLDDDLQSIAQMGFGQNQPQSYQSSKVAGQVKIEM